MNGWRLALMLPALGLGACSESSATQADTITANAAAQIDCALAPTQVERAVCASEAFIATLTPEQREAVLYDWRDSIARTRWSNYPSTVRGQPSVAYERNGLSFGQLSAQSRAAAMEAARAVLSDAGYEDLLGVLAADDYLGTVADTSTPEGFYFDSDYYFISLVGTPSSTRSWMLQITGHHLALNVTYIDGVAAATPYHIGIEPKLPFEFESRTYAPLEDESKAMEAMFQALEATQLDEAYLRDRVYLGWLLGPDEYATGSYDDVVYPSGDGREGVLVSTLTEAQQALVTEAIATWVEDFDPAIATPLLADYTSPAAYADTRIAWSGTESEGVNLDIMGTYLRIDGPRVWIELSCQEAHVVPNALGTHYHAIVRDKAKDYGDLLQ